MTVNGKLMKKSDITADNGVIHILSDVVYPFPSATIAELVAGDDRFSTLLAAVGAAGLAETLAVKDHSQSLVLPMRPLQSYPRMSLMVSWLTLRLLRKFY